MTTTTNRNDERIKVRGDSTSPAAEGWVAFTTAPVAAYAIRLVGATRLRVASNERVQAILDSQLVRMDPVFQKLK